MSILQIKGKTTKKQSEFENSSLSSNSLIFTSAKDENIEEFSIELSLGEGWSESYSIENKKLTEIETDITIARRGSIVVEVSEEIRVPHNRYGIVLPTGSLFLSRGIIIAPAKIEPAFVGKLKLRLFNTTNNKINLKKEEKIASVVFFPTESTKVHEHIYRTSEISSKRVSKMSSLRRWFSSNKIVWIGWIISVVTSSLMTFGLTYYLYYSIVLEKSKPPSSLQNPIPKTTGGSS